jgi:hypothetical protein
VTFQGIMRAVFGCSWREKRNREARLDYLSAEVVRKATYLKEVTRPYRDAADPLVALMVDLKKRRAGENGNGDDRI